MTLQQLKYAVMTEECGSISEASERLFIAQPSLSKSLKILEEELGFSIFERDRKGVKTTAEGTEFLCYAKRVLEQSDRLEEKYGQNQDRVQRFRQRICISSQRLNSATEAFSAVLREFGGEEYTFTLLNSSALQVMEDVLSRKSELGVVVMQSDNQMILQKMLDDNEMDFVPVYQSETVAWMSADHPLAYHAAIDLSDVEKWPVVGYYAEPLSSSYLLENSAYGRLFKKNVYVSCESEIPSVLKSVNGIYIAGKDFLKHDEELTALTLKNSEKLTVGIIKYKNMSVSSIGTLFIEELKLMGQGVKSEQQTAMTYIRAAKMDDLPYIMDIFDYAKRFMAETGNPKQWGDKYPAIADITRDIERQEFYVCVVNRRIEAVFAATHEPTIGYDHLLTGQWIREESEYLTIHRLASWGTQRGMAQMCIEWCERQCGDIRADTHENNKIMQHIFEKNGFTKCGSVKIFDGSVRVAYQKISNERSC